MIMGQSINYSPCVPWLAGKGWNQYTQFGEDGLIDACLERIGETNRHCFEIGAADGSFYSNTLRLRERGWHAVLLEADETQFYKMKEKYGKQSICVHGTIDNLDAALVPTGIDRTPDLGIIDIDGQDYWLWKEMILVRPRVMVVEIFPPDKEALPPTRGQGNNGQAGLYPIKKLGETKGYQLVATTHCNAVFVDGGEL